MVRHNTVVEFRFVLVFSGCIHMTTNGLYVVLLFYVHANSRPDVLRKYTYVTAI